MTPHPEYVDGEMTVETFVHDHLLGRQHSRYPVIDQGAIVGMVSLSEVKTISRSEWPVVRLVDVAEQGLIRLERGLVDPVTDGASTIGGQSARRAPRRPRGAARGHRHSRRRDHHCWNASPSGEPDCDQMSTLAESLVHLCNSCYDMTGNRPAAIRGHRCPTIITIDAYLRGS